MNIGDLIDLFFGGMEKLGPGDNVHYGYVFYVLQVV
jgi:hypothetical protein